MKAARQALGLSQEGLAFDCGLHRTYVSGVERGVRNPTVTVIEKLAAALKIHPGRLLDEPSKADGAVEPAAKPKRGRTAAKASATD